MTWALGVWVANLTLLAVAAALIYKGGRAAWSTYQAWNSEGGGHVARPRAVVAYVATLAVVLGTFGALSAYRPRQQINNIPTHARVEAPKALPEIESTEPRTPSWQEQQERMQEADDAKTKAFRSLAE